MCAYACTPACMQSVARTGRGGEGKSCKCKCRGQFRLNFHGRTDVRTYVRTYVCKDRRTDGGQIVSPPPFELGAKNEKQVFLLV